MQTNLIKEQLDMDSIMLSLLRSGNIEEGKSKSHLQSAMMKKFGDDPLYKAVIMSQSKAEGEKAVKGLISVRGPQAMQQMKDYAKKLMNESVEVASAPSDQKPTTVDSTLKGGTVASQQTNSAPDMQGREVEKNNLGPEANGKEIDAVSMKTGGDITQQGPAPDNQGREVTQETMGEMAPEEAHLQAPKDYTPTTVDSTMRGGAVAPQATQAAPDMQGRNQGGKSKLDENFGRFNTNHSTLTAAVSHARDVVGKKGFTIDDDDWFREISTGPRKPVEGDTNRYTLQLMKNGEYTNDYLHMQIYGQRRGYELNMYGSKASRPRKRIRETTESISEKSPMDFYVVFNSRVTGVTIISTHESRAKAKTGVEKANKESGYVHDFTDAKYFVKKYPKMKDKLMKMRNISESAGLISEKLSLREKREYLGQLNEKVVELKATQGLRAKREILKEINRLQAIIRDELPPEGNSETPNFDALVRGDFDQMDYQEYLKKLDAAFAETNEVQPLKEPAIRYIRTQYNKAVQEGLAMADSLDQVEEKMMAVLESIGDHRQSQEMLIDEEDEIEESAGAKTQYDNGQITKKEMQAMKAKAKKLYDDAQITKKEMQAMCEGMESIAEAADEKPKKKTSKDTANVDEDELEEFEDDQGDVDKKDVKKNLGKKKKDVKESSLLERAKAAKQELLESQEEPEPTDEEIREHAAITMANAKAQAAKEAREALLIELYSVDIISDEVLENYAEEEGEGINYAEGEEPNIENMPMVGEGINPRFLIRDKESGEVFESNLTMEQSQALFEKLNNVSPDRFVEEVDRSVQEGFRRRRGGYSNDPRMITVKYPTMCRETKKPLKKGDQALYYPNDKTFYHPDSKTAQDYRERMDDEMMMGGY